MENCVFCDRDKIKDDVIGTTKNFFEKVGFGLITAGHSMLITSQHLSCFGALPDELDEEFQMAKTSLKDRITRNFYEPFLMEMGIWGQSVHHAHIHFIPYRGEGYTIESAMDEMVLSGPDRFQYSRVKDIGELKEIYRGEGAYVSIEEHGELYVCHVSDIVFNKDQQSPNLSYRSFFTKKLKIPGVSGWKEMSKTDREDDRKKRDLNKEITCYLVSTLSSLAFGILTAMSIDS